MFAVTFAVTCSPYLFAVLFFMFVTNVGWTKIRKTPVRAATE